MENEYCAKYTRVTVSEPESVPTKNSIPSAMASRSGQSSFHPSDLSSDDEEYLKRHNEAETTPGPIDRTARFLTSAWLYLNPLPEFQKHCGQLNLTFNDYHSHSMEISSTFWILDITDWWQQQEETHSKYTNLSDVARDLFSILPHGVRVEASFSVGREVISWRQ